ncbi:MAG: nucleotidyltransferase domain-containing protein [Candidatus Marinimicrobia bacterium]|nr:nucleotidyltransferase domain-containing protein [Candidatus Neomarinimicrobiota bacterium]
MFGLSQMEYNELISVLKKNNVLRAYIFGSRVLGTYKPGSDVDLAIIGDEKPVSYFLNEESRLPYFFDVINLDKVSNRNLIEHIHRHGVKII